MPVPVPAWSGSVPVDAKSLNPALYSTNGTGDWPQGIAFLAQRPTFFESYNYPSTTFTSAVNGSTSSMTSTSGSISTCLVVYDTAGYYGQTSDAPGEGLYRFTQVINGSAGDGVNVGGWEVISHTVPVTGKSTQTAIGAELIPPLGSAISGTRQLPATSFPSAPFLVDLVSVSPGTWHPAVSVHDSGSNTTTPVVNVTDASGQTPRFYSFYAGPSATTAGMAEYTVGGTYEFTAPAGVDAVTVAATGAGSGGGAGDASGGGTEYGGGGAGGGQWAQGTVAVTPLSNYTVTVGSGGAGGTSPGVDGSAGGSSGFTGDAATVTGHAGNNGSGATTSADGAGGNGGTGTSTGATTTRTGGNGVAGATGKYGGGGGSSAGTAAVGNNASGAAGGAAPVGGGPGGFGGQAVVKVVQSFEDQDGGSDTLSVSFGAAVQAGNTVVACVSVQASGEPSSVKLNDGTTFTKDVSANGSGAEVNFSNCIYKVSNVTGGQTSLKVTIPGGSNPVIQVQGWEVSGLGATPNLDDSHSTVATSGSYSSTSNPAAAPDFWVGTVNCQQTVTGAGPSVGAPGSAWAAFASHQDSQGPQHVAQRSGQQVKTTSGSEVYSGSLSSSLPHVALTAAYTTSVVTPGNAPTVPPGGGGGGGLGLNNGGNGDDGQVILTWTEPSGSGYGNPQLPAPYTSYSPATRIGSGTSSSVDVALNSPEGITDVVNFLTSPPVFRIAALSTQSITTATLTLVTFGTSPSTDSYSGWSASTHLYTVARTGLYLFHGLAAYSGSTTGTRLAGAQINGVTYWGPGQPATTNGGCYPAKTQIFDLQAGDTVGLVTRQDSGGSLALTSASYTRLLLVWLGELGVPSTLWTPPDPSYRWASGTDATDLPDLFNEHLGNDLSFLAQRPYLLSYQGTAQTSLPTSGYTPVTLGNVQGLIHGGSGDSYSGWTPGTANSYTAQEPGWYLMCGEFFTTSSGSAGANAAAGLRIPTSGGIAGTASPDIFQQSVVTSTASVGGGAALFGIEYLAAGETVTPVVRGQGYTGGTYSTLVGSANSGAYYPHFEALWLSE